MTKDQMVHYLPCRHYYQVFIFLSVFRGQIFSNFWLFLTFPRIPTLEIYIVPNVCGGLIKTFSNVKYPSPHFWVTLSSMCGVEMREIRDCDNNLDFPILPRLTLTNDSIYNTKLQINEKQKRMHLIFQCDPVVLCSVNALLSPAHVGNVPVNLKMCRSKLLTQMTSHKLSYLF